MLRRTKTSKAMRFEAEMVHDLYCADGIIHLNGYPFKYTEMVKSCWSDRVGTCAVHILCRYEKDGWSKKDQIIRELLDEPDFPFRLTRDSFWTDPQTITILDKTFQAKAVLMDQSLTECIIFIYERTYRKAENHGETCTP